MGVKWFSTLFFVVERVGRREQGVSLHMVRDDRYRQASRRARKMVMV